MFSYYGSKNKIAKLYPVPKYDMIIEPFAGAAWYSVLHKHKNVILNEKYDVIYEIWDWLLNIADEETLSKHLDFQLGQDISSLEIHPAHKALIGFCINRGCSQPCNIVQKWSCQVASKPEWASTTAFQLKRIIKNLRNIKHWKVKKGNYYDLPDIEATWFIDPPYQYGGQYYKENDIDYEELFRWCISRKGQVIVCENSKADWLPFRKLVDINGQKNKTTEVIWLN